MFSRRSLDFIAGALLLGTVATAVVSISTLPISAETFREDATGVLVNIAGDHDLFIVSTAFDIASNLIAIPLAAFLYMVFRSHDRNLALLGSFGFLAAAGIFLTGNMVMISLVSLAQEFTAATGGEARSVLNSARAVGLMADAAFAMGAVALSMGIFSYGLLVLRTDALPRWIGVFGIVGGIVAPFGWLLFVSNDLAAIGSIGLMIGLFFALITGGWLVVKGSSKADCLPHVGPV